MYMYMYSNMISHSVLQLFDTEQFTEAALIAATSPKVFNIHH